MEVKRAADLPVFCEMAYIQYEFFGETFTSGKTHNPFPHPSCSVLIAI